VGAITRLRDPIKTFVTLSSWRRSSNVESSGRGSVPDAQLSESSETYDPTLCEGKTPCSQRSSRISSLILRHSARNLSIVTLPNLRGIFFATSLLLNSNRVPILPFISTEVDSPVTSGIPVCLRRGPGLGPDKNKASGGDDIRVPRFPPRHHRTIESSESASSCRTRTRNFDFLAVYLSPAEETSQAKNGHLTLLNLGLTDLALRYLRLVPEAFFLGVALDTEESDDTKAPTCAFLG
jgi:hypothetical protein